MLIIRGFVDKTTIAQGFGFVGKTDKELLHFDVKLTLTYRIEDANFTYNK